MFVPGAVQGRRIAKFLDAIRNDYKIYDERGRLKYEMTPGEAWRGLIGPTVEARTRFEQFRATEYTRKHYQALRAQAIDAALMGDLAAYTRTQEQIIQMGGNPITMQHVRQELQLRQKTALERRRMGLPGQMELQEPPDRLRLLEGR